MQIKKLLGSVLALALVASVSQANAELLKNFKFGGSVEMSAVSSRNTRNFVKNTNGATRTDRIGTAQTRIMLNMDWDLLDDVHAKVTLSKRNRVYGATADGNSGSENLDTVQTNVLIDQGYFKIDKVFGHVDASFGRQFYGEPGDLIAYYGPKYDQFGMTITAIDGARFDWAGEKAYATAVVFQPNQGMTLAVDPNNGTRVDVRGFIVGNKGHENIDAKVYLWNTAQHGVAVTGGYLQNTNLWIPGFKVKAKFGGLYGSLEAALNMGEDRQNSGGFQGKALLANVGMKADVEQIGTFNPWAEFGYGSGNQLTAGGVQKHNMNFTAIASDYRPGAIYGRFDVNSSVNFGAGVNANLAANNGLRNRVIMGAGVKATPSALNKLTAGLQYYHINFAVNGTAGAAATVASGARHIGSEIDATAEWKHSENVTLKGTVGNFQPGGFITRQIAAGNHPSSAWMSALDVAVKF